MTDPHSSKGKSVDERVRLAENDSRILEIEASLKALQAHRQHLLAENVKLRFNIVAKRVRAAPMRTLIPELCNLIFAFAIECSCTGTCGAENQPIDSPIPECNPLVLAHVCHRWRTMVLKSPCLWADLHIKLRRPKLNLLPFWSRNAGTVPLRVAICPGVACPSGWTSANLLKQLDWSAVKGLIPYLPKIESLSLHVHQAALSVLFPRGSVTRMFKLQRLCIKHHGYILDEHELGKIDAPNLRTLRVSDPSPFVNMLSNSLSNLKQLRVEKIEFWEYPRKVPSLLSSCTAMEEFSLKFPRNLYVSVPDPVTLPAVSRMSLEWHFPCNPILIFSCVRTPQLLQLSLVHSNFLTAFSHEAISSLQDLLKSAPSLASLTLVGCNFASTCDVSSVLYHAPYLEELGLINCHGIGRLLSDLCPADWEQPWTWLCPRLERLKLAGVRDDDLRAMMAFVRRRMEPPTACANDSDHYLKELVIDSRIQDFTTQGRLVILRGLSLISPSVKVIGPLDNVQVVDLYPFSSPVPKN